jgi:hypothetical protein
MRRVDHPDRRLTRGALASRDDRGVPSGRRLTFVLVALALLAALACSGGGRVTTASSGATSTTAAASSASTAAGGSESTTATVSAGPVPATGPATEPTAVTPTAPSPPTPGAPSADAVTVEAVTAADLPSTWREGCPVGPEDLRRVTLPYWGFDDVAHTGTMIVNASVVEAVATVFTSLFDQRFPIRLMQPVDAYGGSDDASIAADNTAGFNCRTAVANGPPKWSQHAYGLAIDVNPVENPSVLNGVVYPPSGAAYLSRDDVRPGMAVPGGPLVSAFDAIGWGWGGRWSEVDYQHFSQNGR